MERTIKITGTGEVSLKPDKISLYITLTKFDVDFENCMLIANQAVNNVKNFLVKGGIEEKSVLTKYFNVRKVEDIVYLQNGVRKTEFKGYEVCHSMSVSFKFNLSLLADVIDALAKSNENPEFNIMFEVDNVKDIEQQLIEKAIKSAKETAEILSNAAEVKLGKIIYINHSTDEDIVADFTKIKMDKAYKSSAISDSLSKINVEDIDFKTSVNIVWEIE